MKRHPGFPLRVAELRFRPERCEIAGVRSRPPAHGLVEVATCQQKGDQHDRSVEIGVFGVHRRFEQRIKDPTKRWKLSPMDLESHRRWYDYSRARDSMLAAR